MKRPTFQTIEKKRSDALLVIDKHNMLVDGLLRFLPVQIPTVVVTSQKPILTEEKPVGYVPFKATMPAIPDSYYSHIFVVYAGEKELLPLIPQFLEKARQDGAKIFFIMDLFFAEPSFLQELIYAHKNAHVLITGDLFGEGAIASSTKTIYRFFEQAQLSGKLDVRGDGLTLLFPVQYMDAIKEIITVAFSPKAPKIGYIFPKHPPTEISLARMLQSINPFLRIDFVSPTIHAAEGMENTQRLIHVGTAGEYLLQSNYPLLRKIKESKLLSEKNISLQKPKEVTIKNEHKEKEVSARVQISLKRLPKKKTFSYSPTAVGFVIFVFFLPFLMTIIFALSGVFALSFAKQSLTSGNLSSALGQANTAYTCFSLAKATDTVVSIQLRMIGIGAQSQQLQTYISLGADGSFAFANVISSANTFLAIVTKQVADPNGSFIEASNSLKKAITIYGKVRAEQSLPQFLDIDPLIKIVSDTIDSYPALLGFDRQKNYLVLFQNNMELRPTGGFIGSYGLLKVRNGSVSDFSIHDVYDADGQLTAHVEPAYPVRRYMGIVHQYLRDSNFHPDFPQAASVSANMLHLETNEVVDGVISVDVSFVKMLVGSLGPLYVSDYKETVTADNFYLLTQSHVEKNFFPGSTQKKDFLRSLFSAIQLKLTDKKTLPYVSLGKMIADAIAQKHMLFAFPDESIQHLFSVNNMSGSLLDSRAYGKNQYNDFLGIIEANIGANKANAFVYRKVEQHAYVNQIGRIQNDVTIRYKNSSTEWPGGDYKNYVRLVVPKGATLTGLVIDGQKQTVIPATTDYLLYERPDFNPPPGIEVETTEEVGKTMFGFLVIVPKGTFKNITVSYQSPNLLDTTSQPLSYDVWFYKQPGTDAYPYSFVFSYPTNYKSIRAKGGLTTLDTSLIFENIISTDQFFHIDLSRQQ